MPPKPSGRGRGRPPKAGGAAKPAIPSGRRRGRPRKSDGAAEPEPDKPATPSGRLRGRPPKADGASKQAEPAQPATPSGRLRARPPKASGAPKLAEPAKPATPSGRLRGRPPKAGGPAAKPAPTKRPRGRPPKAGAAAKPTSTANTTRVTKPTAKTKKPSPSFSLLESATGSYEVTCAEIAGNWGDEDDTYSLNISKYDVGNGLIGRFDFNILEGTMLLAETKTGLDQLVGIASAGELLSESEDEEDEPEPQKLKRGRPAKNTGPQVKTATTLSRRLLVQWRGRETGEGEIQYDNSSNMGYIEFTNNECTKFKGVASFPAVGEKVAFEGVRVGEDPGNTATPWEEFSEKAHEKARVARWH